VCACRPNMCAFWYVCVFVCVILKYSCVCVCMHAPQCVCALVYELLDGTCVCVCLCVCLCVFVCLCMCMCMYVCVLKSSVLYEWVRKYKKKMMERTSCPHPTYKSCLHIVPAFTPYRHIHTLQVHACAFVVGRALFQLSFTL